MKTINTESWDIIKAGFATFSENRFDTIMGSIAGIQKQIDGTDREIGEEMTLFYMKVAENSDVSIEGIKVILSELQYTQSLSTAQPPVLEEGSHDKNFDA